MADMDYNLFVRRYKKRIQSTNDWKFTLQYGYTVYKEKGENQFLTELEDAEEYTEFCQKYYRILRESFNICSAGMWDYFQMYKVKFESDEDKFENELRATIKNFDMYYG